MRDADFLISIKKPIDMGMEKIDTDEGIFNVGKDQFVVTMENSRHGRNGDYFHCGFVNNNFVEIELRESLKEPF